MIVGQDYFPKSSFLAVDKDLALIIQKMMEDQRLMKLLYYTEKDCLKANDLTQEQKYSMIHKQIRIVPQLEVSTECPNYVLISMDNFQPNKKNPVYRDCIIEFDILCHPDHWNLGNFQLRPYKIAGEIDSLFNKKKLTGIGETQFLTGRNLLLNDQLMGLCLTYEAIHGEEDQRNPLL